MKHLWLLHTDLLKDNASVKQKHVLQYIISYSISCLAYDYVGDSVYLLSYMRLPCFSLLLFRLLWFGGRTHVFFPFKKERDKRETLFYISVILVKYVFIRSNLGFFSFDLRLGIVTSSGISFQTTIVSFARWI